MQNLKIKLFADGADLKSIIELSKNPQIQGFTSNPTLMRKAGIQDYKLFAKEVLNHIKEKPMSFEVFADDFDEMYKQAKEISSWGDNVYVKIPVTNTKGESACGLVKTLTKENVKVNVTAVFTIKQCTDIAFALHSSECEAICSIFAGRIHDTGVNPTPIVKAALCIFAEHSPKTEVLWASPRCIGNVMEAELSGCHIITATPDILSKLNLLGKDLTEYSLDTVKMFYNDAKSSAYTL